MRNNIGTKQEKLNNRAYLKGVKYRRVSRNFLGQGSLLGIRAP